MKQSEILREARKFIYSGHEHYICKAINRVTSEYTPAKRYIHKILGKYITLESWLQARGINSYLDKNKKNRMRITRLAWIDDMIRYWEAWGD